MQAQRGVPDPPQVLDVPAGCTLEWIDARSSTGVAQAITDAAGMTPSMTLVKGKGRGERGKRSQVLSK